MYFCGVIILLWIALLEKLANPLERQVFIYFNQHLNSTKDVTFIEIKRMYDKCCEMLAIPFKLEEIVFKNNLKL